MTRSYPNHNRSSTPLHARRSSLAPADYPIRHTHDWRGRDQFVIQTSNQQYRYPSLEAALRARERLRGGQLAVRKPSAALGSERFRGIGRQVLASVIGTFVLVMILFRLYPLLLLNAVDLSRSIFGPAAVARVETAVFDLQSLFRQARVGLGDTAPRWQLSQPANRKAVFPIPTARIELLTPRRQLPAGQVVLPTRQPTLSAPLTATPLPPTVTQPLPINEATTATIDIVASATPINTPIPAPAWVAVAPTAVPSPTPQQAPAAPQVAGGQGWPPAPLAALINDGQLAGEGQWRLQTALGDGGNPVMAVTQLRPDPARPDIQVALVAIDLTRAQLHLVAGTQEPPSPGDAARIGQIPPELQASGTLLAGFNGGFKAIHGNDGMFADGSTYLPPQSGRATLAVSTDGGVRIGLWGRDLGDGDTFVAWRQNGLLLVDNGAVTEEARAGGLGWGATLELRTETWRSGVGLTPDRRTLFYAVGDGLTTPRLAEVLRAAGASMAMQMDINNYWVRFVTFQRGDDGQPFSQELISAMPAEPRKYLVPDARDFCYLVAR